MKLPVCDLSKRGELWEDDDGAAVVSSTSWKSREGPTVGSHMNVQENMQECCMDFVVGLFSFFVFLNQRVSDEESVVTELKIAQGHKHGG